MIKHVFKLKKEYNICTYYKKENFILLFLPVKRTSYELVAVSTAEGKGAGSPP